jgi:hypothetical protein
MSQEEAISAGSSLFIMTYWNAEEFMRMIVPAVSLHIGYLVNNNMCQFEMFSLYELNASYFRKPWEVTQ